MATLNTSSTIASLPADFKSHNVNFHIHIHELSNGIDQKTLNGADVTPEPTTASTTPPAAITIPSDFSIHEVDDKLDPKARPDIAEARSAPLGVLANFTGEFAGTGFNLIFRPNSGPPTTTTFPNPVSPAPPAVPSENVLELNLTTETLTFSTPLGSVPNRGLQQQNDIFLNGVPYVQAINDVTNKDTGKGDGKPTGIHFEPGLWMHIPSTSNDPSLGESLVRMASIPHGTTINAEGLAPTKTFAGPPIISSVDITPFPIGGGKPITFISQTASNTDTPRIPQDLTKFIAEGTITQDILTDPNTVLRNAIAGQNITKTIVFTVSTAPASPELGGGTANIAFLQGTPGTQTAGGPQVGPNANAAQMSATFWIETVEYKIVIPPFKPGQTPLNIAPDAPNPGVLVPTFEVNPPHEITVPTTITVHSTQIQYSQLVFLNFAGLTWPHVSVATLVPSTLQAVPPSVWN
ncbi:hypothetical protein N431DRAFT_553946 [Stipitochalara longipes BDJ]|nr:hypothetical protein N431DRAFT_553946 [Stipitochalara longipes BDJ]